jgi:starch synthase (maltosyl-transferring)
MTTAPSRVQIEDVTPLVDGGAFPLQRVVGEPVVVAAAVFADGHDVLYVELAHRGPGDRRWAQVPMVCTNAGLDRWEARFVPDTPGEHRYRVMAWVDRWASWAHGTLRKIEAGQLVVSECLEGASMLEAAAERATKSDAAVLRTTASTLRTGSLEPVTDPEVAGRWRRTLRAGDAATSATYVADVERDLALNSAWYELFPRSLGTLRDVIDHVPDVAAMGFDVLYLPPIHPIGTSFRKGPNNAEAAGPADPGSPWAIGSADGGHTSVDPALGTVNDVADLVAACTEHGLELALDIALQCSPDHPWVTEHPEFFRHRPDGTIHYAENPPKKYQDIYPLDFDGPAWRELWDACLAIFQFWADKGVTVFRVDNPHTKPFAFWEWLIAELRREFPGVIFLSEAFARPRIMHGLTKRGFTQSYTYFPWRQQRHELIDYFTELSTAPSVDQFRPNSWPNTPDILTHQLMGAPRELFALRLLLAATLSPSYGIYGPAFELGDNVPAGNGKEEYGDSEKYQLRRWARADPTSLAPLVKAINAARHRCAALGTLRTLRFVDAGNEALLAFTKTPHLGANPDPARPEDNPVLVVVNLDPVMTHAGMVAFDPSSVGIDPWRSFEAHDELSGQVFTWSGDRHYVQLAPADAPGHVLRLNQPPR